MQSKTHMSDIQRLATEQEKDNAELSLRPQFLNEFIGQNNLKQNLGIFINAAMKRKEPLDHTLFYGPPGLGKTTLAHIIAREMGSNLKATAGPVIAKSGDIAAILTNLEPNDILFIDEIHRLNPAIEEILYSAMEDFVLDIIIGEGPSARSVRIDIAPFCLVGATTRMGLISNPLRDRFGIPLRLEFYSAEDLYTVVLRGADLLSTKITKDAAIEVAARSRGTPRIALRLLKRVRDYGVANNDTIDTALAKHALEQLDIDNLGLDSNDRRYLHIIAQHYNGGPVGIETIATAMSEDKDNIEDTIEPFLIQQGFVQRTARGRMLTEKSFYHIGLPMPLQKSSLFDSVEE